MTFSLNIKRASLAALIFASLVTSVPTEASVSQVLSNALTTARKNPKGVVAATLGLAFLHSVYLFHLREPDFSPDRYELSKLKDWQLFLNNPRAYLNNLWYTYEDGLVGNCFKQSSIKADWQKDENGKEKFVMLGKKDVPSRGIYGAIHSRTRPVLYTCKFPLYVAAFGATTKFGAAFYTEVFTRLQGGESLVDAMINTTAKYLVKVGKDGKKLISFDLISDTKTIKI